MAYTSGNPNGQAAMTASTPVVVANDQTTIKTKLANDIANTTGSITSTSTTITTGALSGVGSATVSIYGTHAGVNVAFEGSDSTGSNWVAIPAQPLGSVTPTPVLASGVLATNSTNIWNIAPLLGIQYVRVRATAWTSGSASVIIAPSAQFTQPIVNVGSGTLNANLNNDAVVTGSLSSSTLTLTTASLVGAGTATIQVVGTGWSASGNLVPSASLDGTNYVTLGSTAMLNIGTGSYVGAIPSATQGMWQVDVSAFNYLRLTMTGTVGATAAAVTIKTSGSTGMVALDAPLPVGTNSIGNLGTVSTVSTVTAVTNVATIGTSVTPGSGAALLGKTGSVVSAATDTGVSVLGFRAPTTPFARGTAGNYQNLMADAEGKLVDIPYADPANGWYAVLTLTSSTTSTALKAAGAAGIRTFVTSATVSNSSATPTLATLLDNTTVIWQSWIAANGSVTATFGVPLRGTAATALNAQSSVSVASLYFAASGFIGI